MMYNFCHSLELNQLLEHLIVVYLTKQFKIIEEINFSFGNIFHNQKLIKAKVQF